MPTQAQPQEQTPAAQLPPDVTQIVTQSYADDDTDDGYSFVIINVTPQYARAMLRRMDFVKRLGFQVSFVVYRDGTPDFIAGRDENEHVWELIKEGDMAVLRGTDRLDFSEEDNSESAWRLDLREAHVFDDAVVFHADYKHSSGSAYTPSIAREVFEQIAGEEAGPCTGATDEPLTPAECRKLLLLLDARFPELATDADMNGGDTIQALGDLYASLFVAGEVDESTNAAG